MVKRFPTERMVPFKELLQFLHFTCLLRARYSENSHGIALRCFVDLFPRKSCTTIHCESQVRKCNLIISNQPWVFVLLNVCDDFTAQHEYGQVRLDSLVTDIFLPE